MAEEYVSYDKYRADLADFRADMSQFREEVRKDLGDMRKDLSDLRVEMHKGFADQTKWTLGAIVVVAGLALSIAKLF